MGSITVREAGERADQLVCCLRAHAQQYSIGIEQDPAAIMVVDIGGPADDLSAFLRERLDGCSRELGFDWRDHLAIDPSNRAGRAQQE